ncbi:dnaJ homolog subfamily C member 8 [Trichonephila clavata]|uniref:DnaJ homolog subfamily C member 8 n=1 Tax=Trichonephila clavata TaxID=2740835 RepID=A0A8X6IL56_TRICU|nr:dnaJ homolog subfamily C member 8 [Trichonephila clavata]
MASSLSQQHSTVGDDAVDAMDKFINESGCADMHYKLQCFYKFHLYIMDLNIPLPSAAPSEALFSNFIAEVKEIEKRDSVLTPKQQIDRLLRPGSTYFNLNPFEVLQLEPETSIEDLKKQYRRLSILVHPDKNPNDRDRAQQAFDIVNKAYKCLEDDTQRAKALEIVEEAKGRTDMMIEEKRKKQKKAGKGTKVDEDDPVKYKHAIYVLTMKLFADLERKRRQTEERNMEDRKRKRETEIEEEEKKKIDKEWQKNYEESRDNRINSWKAFQSNTKSKKKVKEFRPPKHKAETR